MPKPNTLSLLSESYLPLYLEQLTAVDWPEYVKNVPKISFTADTFGFYASVSSVYSSKIEGEPIVFMLPQAIHHKP